MVPQLSTCEYHFMYNAKTASEQCLTGLAMAFLVEDIDNVRNSDNTTLLKCR